jgi:hypothetical protein
MRLFILGFPLGLLSFACIGDPPESSEAAKAVPAAVTSDAGVQPDTAKDAPPSDAPTALRVCVLACQRLAPIASSKQYYSTLQECACQPDLGKCDSVCPKYCSGSAPVDNNACNDCVVRSYVDTCSIKVNCMGDFDCVNFADCTRACATKNP